MGTVSHVVRKWEFRARCLGGQPVSSDVRPQEM